MNKKMLSTINIYKSKPRERPSVVGRDYYNVIAEFEIDYFYDRVSETKKKRSFFKILSSLFKCFKISYRFKK